MSERQLVVVTEGINDHENLGALFRNAAAFGVDALLLDPSSADPLYRRSVRVSMGHVLDVPFARVGALPQVSTSCGQPEGSSWRSPRTSTRWA